MQHPRHDPAQRLNAHHADDMLAIARSFGGAPDATSAAVVAIDETGISLAIDAPRGATEVRIRFDTIPDLDRAAPLRMIVRELSRRAGR